MIRPRQPVAITLEAPCGRTLRVQAVPGRGWRCSWCDQADHERIPLYASLRAALVDCVPGMGDDDPWLLATLRALAPDEAGA